MEKLPTPPDIREGDEATTPATTEIDTLAAPRKFTADQAGQEQKRACIEQLIARGIPPSWITQDETTVVVNLKPSGRKGALHLKCGEAVTIYTNQADAGTPYEELLAEARSSDTVRAATELGLVEGVDYTIKKGGTHAPTDGLWELTPKNK